MVDDSRRDYVQSVERCLTVITAYTDGARAMSFAELAALTGLSKPTVRRMLLTLRELGYVRSEGARFGLTPKVLQLGYAYLSSLNLPEMAQPYLEALTDQLRTSTALVTLDGADIVYVNRVHRHRITSISLAIGTRLPAHATAGGHVLLADLKPDALADYFAQARLEALTHLTLTTEEGLRERLALVRQRGWDAVDQELETGRRSAAAPVRDANGAVLAALSLSCGATEASLEQLVSDAVPSLVAAAEKISAALGGRGYARAPTLAGARGAPDRSTV